MARRNFWEAVPLLILVMLLPIASPRASRGKQDQEALQLAAWAQRSTWGGSMFLFPDAGKERYPGLFRAGSQRAVWVDWQTGTQVAYFDSFADEWQRRWQDTMAGQFSPQRLQQQLALPIDYFVLKQANALAHIKPLVATSQLVVYDARDLRSAMLSSTQ